MFRKSLKVKQIDLFNNLATQLNGKSLDLFNDKNGWHNVFRNQVFNKIDELIFACLFDKSEGAPNFPVNVLIGMMILKTGFGFSDKTLFDACRFNALYRSALGMLDFKEAIPSEASYYNLKKRISKYDIDNSDDLILKMFSGITSEQCLSYNVDGKSVRMDSKLLGSNIARVSRFELVHSVIKKFHKSLSGVQKGLLTEELGKKLDSINGEDGEKTVYRSKDTELATKLTDMGDILYQLVHLYEGQSVEHYELIRKVLGQQFTISEEKVSLKPREELKASNIQSAHDADCDYRKKGDQEIFGGYSANITETCSKCEDKGIGEGEGEVKLNLITVPEVKPATAADNEFYQAGILQTQELTKQDIKESFADGAYHSQDNKTFNQKEEIEMILTGLQGREGRLSFDYQGDNLIAIDKETGKPIEIKLTPKGKSYKVMIDGKSRYIKQQEIENYFFRKEMKSIPQEKRNRRNNVEATIFQISYFTRNNKVRYRGLKAVQYWLYMRCLWVNMVRIKNHMVELCPKSTKNGKNGLTSALYHCVKSIFDNFHEICNFQIKLNSLRFEWILILGKIPNLIYTRNSHSPIFVT